MVKSTKLSKTVGYLKIKDQAQFNLEYDLVFNACHQFGVSDILAESFGKDDFAMMDKILDAARAKQIQTVIIPSFGHLSKGSAESLNQNLSVLIQNRVRVLSLEENYDSLASFSRAMRAM